MKTKMLRTFVALLLTTLATVTAWAADKQPPTISNKTITITKTEMYSISIKWEKATDDFTPQNQLKYTIQCKLSSEDVYKNVSTFTDVNNCTILRLEYKNTAYDIRVFVEDTQKNKAYYDVITAMTKADTEPPVIKNKNVGIAKITETEVYLKTPRTDFGNVSDNDSHFHSGIYLVKYKKENEDSYTITEDGMDNRIMSWDWDYDYFKVSPLEPRTKYEFILMVGDISRNWAEYKPTSATTLSKSNPPVLSDSYVRVKNVTTNSAEIYWALATDDVTPQQKLFYSVWGVPGLWNDREFGGIKRPNEGYNRNQAVAKGLKPNTKYTIKVSVYDEGDHSTMYEPITFKTLPIYYEKDQTAPEISNKKLTVTNATDNSLTLNWTKAKDNLFDDEDLSYTVMYRESSSGRYSRDGAEQGNDISSSRITSLKPNTTYEFCVRVKDRVGNTSTYDILTYTTSNAQDKTAPTIANKTVTAADVTYGSVALSWNKATDNVTKQENLQYSVYRDGVLCKKLKGETSYIVGDLNPSTKYTFEVRVEDEAGNVSKYNTVQATTKAKPVTVEKYPLFIEGTQVTSANAKDFWGDGGTISYEPTTKTLKLNWAELNSLIINDNITINLVGWTTIYGLVDVRGSSNVTIKADDNYGENAQLKILGQLYCTCDLAIKNECTVEIDATGKINNPGLILNDHKLSVYGSTLKVKGDSKNVTVSGIGELYMQDCRITSEHKYDSTNHKFLNADGSIAKDDVIISTEIIRVPVLVNDEIEVEGVTEDGALLSWVEATDDNTPQSDLVYTLYTMRRYGDTDYLFYTDGRNLTSCKLYNLKPNTEYYAMVRVEDKDAHLTFYKETSFTTLPESDKTAPTLSNSTINVTDVTDNSVSISWDKASDDSTVQDSLYYTAGYSEPQEQGGSSIKRFVSKSTVTLDAVGYGNNMTSCTIDNLEPETPYDFYVVVYDKATNGTTYTKKTVVTKALPDVTAPSLGEITISVDDLTRTGISLSWNHASDDRTPQDKLAYSVEYLKAGESAWITRNAGNANSHTIDGLTEDTDYEVSIKVADEAGNETSYGRFTITTLPDPATAVKNATTNAESDGKMYSTSGIRVDKNFRGIVIMNGKKVMVK